MNYFAVINGVAVSRGFSKKQAGEKAKEQGYSGFTIMSEYDVRRSGSSREQVQEIKDKLV